VSAGKDGLVKGKMKVQKSLGLGHRPNVIPAGLSPSIRDEPRTVHIGWHPVAGSMGKWFAETGLGKLVTDKIHKYPDPTQHWAVLVGDYGHELWMVRSAEGFICEQHCDTRADITGTLPENLPRTKS